MDQCRSAVPAGAPRHSRAPGAAAPAGVTVLHCSPSPRKRQASFLFHAKNVLENPIKAPSVGCAHMASLFWRCPCRALLYPELLLLGSCISLLSVPLMPACSSPSFSPFPASNHSIISLFAGRRSPPCRCPRPSFVIAVVISRFEDIQPDGPG